MFSHRFLTLVPAVLAAAMLASAAENEAQENTAPGQRRARGRNFGFAPLRPRRHGRRDDGEFPQGAGGDQGQAACRICRV